MEEQSSAKGLSQAHRIVRATFVTEESVYGVLLVSGMIVASGGHGESSWRVFWSVAITVVVFWAAHVYAGTVAHHGLDHDRVVGLKESLGIALLRSRGLLLSATIPLLILLLGATRAIPDNVAIWAALWAGVVVLAVLGFIAFHRRGAPWPVQVLGALVTAGFGIALIVLKAVIH
jgi:RsiW-degrading membrane proteinase PrsW (M82 family)